MPLGQPPPYREEQNPVNHNSLADLERPGLERLKLAADVILAEGENIHDALTAELTIFRDRVEHALLLPTRSKSDSRTDQ
jgi:hypothetical protein